MKSFRFAQFYSALGLAVLLLIGCEGNHKSWTTATVTAKYFTPATSGTGITTNGHVAIVNTSEQFTVFLKFEDGQDWHGTVAQGTWESVSVGQQVSVEISNWYGVENIVAPRRTE
jgi:hypothetical protein